MSQTPVVLIGTRADGSIGVIGIYEDAGMAQQAVHSGQLPSDIFYAVIMPDMNSYVQPRAIGSHQGN